LSAPIRLAAGLALALVLTGCSYDYLQRTDRVAYSTGDAVRSNLERETTNPSRRSQALTTGLGRDGLVVKPPDPVIVQ